MGTGQPGTSIRLAICRYLAAALFIAFSGTSQAASPFNAQGTNLTVTTTTLKVTFRGPDVVGISNQSTGENYLRPYSANPYTGMSFANGSGRSLTWGNWTVDGSGTNASTTGTDSNGSTVQVAVSVDSATQEVVVDLNGEAKQGGIRYLQWGLAGFDMTAGRFILPANGGLSLTSRSLTSQAGYSFGNYWQAPLSLFQGAQGGVSVYSTDTQSLCKDLYVGRGQEQTALEQFIVEAQAPWQTATEAGPVEWRLAAYQGDWQAGARAYRDWHTSTSPPTPPTGARAWSNNIKTVVILNWSPPYDPSALNSLVGVLKPSQTLLYLKDWRKSSYDRNYPDYTPDPSAQALVQRAHQLGFYVMLHTNIMGVSPSNPNYAAVQQFQYKDPTTLQPDGWLWTSPASTPGRIAYINPASSAYRKLYILGITPAIQMLQPDAIHLDVSDAQFNDGNGLIEGMSFKQGAAQLHRDILAAFPGLVLGGEGIYDALAPYESFAQAVDWSGSNLGLDPDDTPPLPISAFVLPNVQFYSHLSAPNPYEFGFIEYFQQYVAQAVLPTYNASGLQNASPPDYTQPDMARYLKIVTAFEQNALQPDWDSNWNGAVLRYKGTNGSSATLTDTGTIAQFNLQQASGTTLLSQFVHDSNQAKSPPFIPNWPASSSTTALGLDPSYAYWLDAPSGSSNPVHISSLTSGVKLGLGAGTLVTPDFAYFQLLPISQAPFDFFASLWSANMGVTFNGTDLPLSGSAGAYVTTMVAGGVSRNTILTQPPYTSQFGGEFFIEYTVPIPNGYAVNFSFAVGMPDSDTGRTLYKLGPLTFKVEVNGTVLWKQDASAGGGWQAGNLDLSGFLGQTVKIRLVTNPGPSGNPYFGAGGWSALQFSTTGKPTLADLTLALPASVPSSNIIVPGGSVSVGNGTATISGFPVDGTVVVLVNPPHPVTMGQSLLSVPFHTSQSSDGQLAGPPQAAGAGAIHAASAGGINKAQTVDGTPPFPSGQTILSWSLQLPKVSSLSLSFSTGLQDGAAPFQAVLLYVRVNGTILWSYAANPPSAWIYGVLDLSPWSGQNVVLDLVSDSQGFNSYFRSPWAELTIASGAGSTCAASIDSNGGITAPAAGVTGTITVSAASGCNWSTESNADWVNISPSAGAGTGAATYTVSPNAGPARSTTIVVGGHLLTVNQATAPAVTPSTPSIAGVVNGADFKSEALSAGAWISVFGQYLGQAATWSSANTVTLGGASVSICGLPAVLSYNSGPVTTNGSTSWQLNALVPDGVAGQTSCLVVVTAAGLASQPASVAIAGGVIELFGFTSSAGPLPILTHADYSLVGPVSAGLTPAKPNETVIAWGTGDCSGPGLTVGGTPATVVFSGRVAPGLCQINFVVPNSPTGSNQLKLSTSPNLYSLWVSP